MLCVCVGGWVGVGVCVLCVCVGVGVDGRTHISEHIRIISIFSTSKHSISQADPVKRSSDAVEIRPNVEAQVGSFLGQRKFGLWRAPSLFTQSELCTVYTRTCLRTECCICFTAAESEQLSERNDCPTGWTF